MYIYDVDFDVYASDTDNLLKQTLLYNQKRVADNKLYQQNQLILEKSQKYNIQTKQNSTQTENIQISQNIVEKQDVIFDQENNTYYRKIDNIEQQNKQQQIQRIIGQQFDQQLINIQQPKVQFTRIQLQNLQNIEEIYDLKLLYQQQQYNLQGGLVLLNNFECTQPITINISSYILDDFTLVINNKILITFPPNFILNQQKFNQSTIDQQTNIVIDVQGIVTPKVQNPQNYLIFNNNQLIDNLDDNMNSDQYYNMQQNEADINNKNTTYIVDTLLKKQDKQITLQDNINEVKDTTQKLVDEIQAQKAILQKFVKHSKCINSSINSSVSSNINNDKVQQNNINNSNLSTDKEQQKDENINTENPVILSHANISQSDSEDNLQDSNQIQNNQQSVNQSDNKITEDIKVEQNNNQPQQQQQQQQQQQSNENNQQKNNTVENINQKASQNINQVNKSQNDSIIQDVYNNAQNNQQTTQQSIPTNNTANTNNTIQNSVEVKMNKLNQILDDVLQSSDSANVSVGFSPVLLQKLKQQIQSSNESSSESSSEVEIKKQTTDKIDEITKNKLWLKQQAQKIYDGDFSDNGDKNE